MKKLTLDQKKIIVGSAPANAELYAIANCACGALYYSEIWNDLHVWSWQNSAWKLAEADVVGLQSLKELEELLEDAGELNKVVNQCAVSIAGSLIHGTYEQAKEIQRLVERSEEFEEFKKSNMAFPVERRVGECSISEGGLSKLEYFTGQFIAQGDGITCAISRAKNLIITLNGEQA